jgi:hypothetical protein
MCFSCNRQDLSPSREKIQLDFIVLCFITITNSVDYLDNWLDDVWLSRRRQCTNLEFTWKDQKLHTIWATKKASRRAFETLIARIQGRSFSATTAYWASHASTLSCYSAQLITCRWIKQG